MAAHSNIKRCFFRADASTHLGAGHVMRCLALAQCLDARGVKCTFLMATAVQPSDREKQLTTALTSRIAKGGHQIAILTLAVPSGAPFSSSDQQADACAVCEFLANSLGPKATANDGTEKKGSGTEAEKTLVVVDHYQLDHVWESLVVASADILMVIDDLANRRHDCDVLLDQTYLRTDADYAPMVSPDCQLLLGADYALLRPEFSRRRPEALARRAHLKEPKKVLINFGGSVQDALYIKTLSTLAAAFERLPLEITLVVGGSETLVTELQALARNTAMNLTVLNHVDDMATLMTSADIAIGAAGSSVWERCALGLPSIMCVIASNQALIAANLASTGAVNVIDAQGAADSFESELTTAFRQLLDIQYYRKASLVSADICDGDGVAKVVEFLACLAQTPFRAGE